QVGLGSMILSLLLIMTGLAALATFGPEGYSERIVSIVDHSKDTTGSAIARQNAMEGTLRGLLDHPFGVGLNMNILYLYESGFGWNWVHNVYLQIASDLGVLPGLLFIVLLWKLTAAMRRISSSQTSSANLGLVA